MSSLKLSCTLLGSPGFSGLSWALLGSPVLFCVRLGSPGLVWAPLDSPRFPELSWAPWALLASPGLSLGYLRVAGRHSDTGRHTLGSLAATVMLGAIP